MIDTEELKNIRKTAIQSVKLKLEQAERGHAWTVLNMPLNSFQVIEMTSELLNFRRKFGEFEGIAKDTDALIDKDAK